MSGQAERAAQNSAVERLARVGLTAKGVLYTTVAVLALQLAFGLGGEATDQQGALRALGQQPFGQAILGLLAVGLAAYALWRLSQFVLDPSGSDDAKGKAERLSYLLRALVYAVLCVTAVRLLTGSESSSGGEEQAASGLLGVPGGRILVAVIGVVIAGVGLYQGRKGITRDFVQDLQTARMSASQRAAVTRLGVAGLLARAVVFTLIGFFFLSAALADDASRARGLDAALAELAQTPAGPWLLVVVAAGLLAYGLFSFALARYGRVRGMD